MKLTLMDNAAELRARFFERFVMTWEEFQATHADWIAELADKGYTIDRNWYSQAYMWDRMSPTFPSVSFREALAVLRSVEEPVLFLSELPDHHSKPRLFHAAEHHTDFAAVCDPAELADLLEEEWFKEYRLAEQNMYNPNRVLPYDVYVTDHDMTWFIAFTSETTDWDSELTDPMKAAESRYCICTKSIDTN